MVEYTFIGIECFGHIDTTDNLILEKNNYSNFISGFLTTFVI
jgi:hypothetical protein